MFDFCALTWSALDKYIRLPTLVRLSSNYVYPFQASIPYKVFFWDQVIYIYPWSLIRGKITKWTLHMNIMFQHNFIKQQSIMSTKVYQSGWWMWMWMWRWWNKRIIIGSWKYWLTIRAKWRNDVWPKGPTNVHASTSYKISFRFALCSAS